MAFMKIRSWLGLVKQDEFEVAEKILCQMILNSSLATWMMKIQKDENQITTARFCIPGVTHIHRDKSVTSGDLNFVLDVTNYLVKSARYNHENISLNDAISLAFISWAGQTHPVMHSFANWAVNPFSSNRFIRHMSLITITYNFFGIEAFPVIVDFLRTLGICRYLNLDIGKVVTHQGPHTVPPHLNILSLKKYSRYLNFFAKTRKFFLQEFSKYKEDFAGIDGEALFISTIGHSVEHALMARLVNLTNFKGTVEFEADQEMAGVILSGFTDKPVLNIYDASYHKAPHPFFRAVYKFGSLVDKKLADMMDCAINV